jgi:hypothetical protein
MRYAVRGGCDSKECVFAKNKVHVVTDFGWDFGGDFVGHDKTSCSVETDVFRFGIVWKDL